MRERVNAAAHDCNVAVTCIGDITEQPGLLVLDPQGQPLLRYRPTQPVLRLRAAVVAFVGYPIPYGVHKVAAAVVAPSAASAAQGSEARRIGEPSRS